jgi:hypothetical protein
MTEVSVLFSSSPFCESLREALTEKSYSDFKYYIGCILLFACFVSVTGIIATFTAWSMISALSETNARCLLRSSLGQYIAIIPSRFATASLYLFVLWLLLFTIDLVAGPACFVLVTVLLVLFFHTIVSLSAFGRLILSTGAMGEPRVLKPEFESDLLPSGLHVALTLKSVERMKRNESVSMLYRRRQSQRTESLQSDNKPSPRSVESASTTESDRALTDLEGGISVIAENAAPSTPEPESLQEDLAETLNSNGVDHAETTTPGSLIESRDETKTVADVQKQDQTLEDPQPEVLSARARQSSEGTANAEQKPSEDDHISRRTRSILRASSIGSSISRRQMEEEWESEESVRSMYSIDPPSQFFDEIEASTEGFEVMTPESALFDRQQSETSQSSLRVSLPKIRNLFSKSSGSDVARSSAGSNKLGSIRENDPDSIRETDSDDNLFVPPEEYPYSYRDVEAGEGTHLLSTTRSPSNKRR